MSVHAWFSSETVSVAPGTSLSLPLTVHNLGSNTESYTIVPAGFTASWIGLDVGNLTLFGGTKKVIQVTVTPPALPSTTAGPTSVAVRIIPVGDPDDAAVADATLEIETFDDCRLVPLQPIHRARHRATYEFMVENHGNAVASCRLHLVDSSERIDGDFDPPAVGVGPGAASLVRLKARARRGAFRRSSRTLDFDIEAARQGFDPVSTPLSFVQSPTIPAGVILRTAAVVAILGGLALAWFAVVKPTIEDAASDRVDERIVELVPIPGGVAPDPAVTTAVPATGQPAEIAGVPMFLRLTVEAPLAQTLDQSSTIPDGGPFDMTDVRVENSSNDKGTATLTVNGEPLFHWSLENIRGVLFEPSITPIRLEPGDNLTFSVKCDEIGDTSRSTCAIAVNIKGETLPATDD